MFPHDQLKEHNHETLLALEAVYSEIHRLYARMSRTEGIGNRSKPNTCGAGHRWCDRS